MVLLRTSLLFLLIMVVAACEGNATGEVPDDPVPDDPATDGADTVLNDDPGAVDDPAMDATDTALNDDPGATDDPVTDDADTVASDDPYDAPEIPDEDMWQAEGGDPVDLDPGATGCALPADYLNERPGVPSQVAFTFNGTINDPELLPWETGTATVRLKHLGQWFDGATEPAQAFFYAGNGSTTGHRIVVKSTGVVDAQNGYLYYVEIKAGLDDMADSVEPDGHTVLLENSTTDTNIAVYKGWQDGDGNIVKLCLEAVPTGQEGEGSFYLCSTDYQYTDFIDNYPDTIGFAGNAVLFDDTVEIKKRTDMLCVCANGAGGWRNCDEGIPTSYGLFRAKLSPTPNYTGYIYDEEKLFPGGQLDTAYAQAHAEGIWQDYDYAPAPFNGGLNIGRYTEDMGEGLFGFGIGIPPNGYKTIALLSRHASSGTIILRQQSFYQDESQPSRFWLNAYFPDSVTNGPIAFGTAVNEAKVIVYHSTDECVMAYACGGQMTITKAEDINVEGGILEFATELTNNTKYVLPLHHPYDDPVGCSFADYITTILPDGATICAKE